MCTVDSGVLGQVWYNITMQPVGVQDYSMQWGHMIHPSGTLLQGDQGEFKMNSGTKVTFKLGLDDTSGNSTFAHIYPDFFMG